MLSDFIDDKFDNSVRLIAKKHDLTGIRVFDKFEEKVFSMGLNLFYDTENELYQWIDTSDPKVRNKIQQKYNQRLDYFRNTFLKSGASIVNMSTQESYVKKLLELFKSK